jgi:PAB1-binding protein PBP1
VPDDNGEKELSLEQSIGKDWDQFEVNEKQFGVTTDFKEELYTTTLDKTRADYKEKEARAAKLAWEIENVIIL